MNYRSVCLCAIVPSHNHWQRAGEVVAQLSDAGMPVFVMDDGSGEPARGVLAGLADARRQIIVTRLDPNRGKGGAVIAGFQLAIAAGFSHAVQVDADGQHDLASLGDLLAQAARFPKALISGRPIYDGTIPLGRKIGRWITHLWVWIETLSLRISDSMCGFRVYPLAAVGALLEDTKLGQHMDFDTDIMVRLFWAGTPVVMRRVKVTYPPGNSSNFQLWADNWRITKMHTRLVIDLLMHFPAILRARPPLLNRDF
jgi:hypothetical protein